MLRPKQATIIDLPDHQWRTIHTQRHPVEILTTQTRPPNPPNEPDEAKPLSHDSMSDNVVAMSTISTTPRVSRSNTVNDGGRQSSPPPIRLNKFHFAKRTTIPIHRQSMLIPAPQKKNVRNLQGLLRRAYLQTKNTYYQHIPIRHDQSRLLLLKPGEPGHEINVTLLTVEDALLGQKYYDFAALSYHWGGGEADCTIIVSHDPNSAPIPKLEDAVIKKMSEGSLREKKFSIGANLFDALLHFRDKESTLALWVDALCINQSDLNEKSEQVRKMNQIYRKAYNVCIWLGSGDPTSEKAMAFIPRVIDPDNHELLLNNDVDTEYWASSFELLKWSW